MNKKIINTILLSMCSVSVLSAAPVLNSSVSPAEVNFTGIWESHTCEGRPLTHVEIVQDNQDYIQLNGGDPSVIGTLTTYTTTNIFPRSSNPSGNITSIDWNDDKTELNLKHMSVLKESGGYSGSLGYSLHWGVVYINLSMNKDGQLLLKVNRIGYRDLEMTEQPNESICVFNKVADAPTHKSSSWNALTSFQR